MRAVAADLPAVAKQPGRLTKWSAEGMLARFYLTRAGVESSGGTRKQEFLDSAKYFAADVINNSGKKLLDNYEDLFRWSEKTGYRYDNNTESLFELQWIFSNAWGVSNSTPEQIAYSGEIAYSGWGGSKGATFWMLSLYDGFKPYGTDTIKGRTTDQRLHATFMLPGFAYPYMTKKSDKTPFVFPMTGTDANYASLKKYVIGGPDDLGANASSQHYPNNTYMMRLSEMYLIYAEATIGNSGSTTDATAVAYFNKVHQRAGLTAWTVSGPNANGPLTLDAVLYERFKEFAMESSTWYDIVSLHYWNPAKALNLLNSQDRGLFVAKPDNVNNPTEWTIIKTSWFTPRTVVANEGNFVIPIPAIELSQAPWLNAPAVEYP